MRRLSIGHAFLFVVHDILRSLKMYWTMDFSVGGDMVLPGTNLFSVYCTQYATRPGD